MTATCLVAKQRNFVESKGQFLESSKTMLSHTGPVIQCQTHMRPSSKQTPSSWQLTLVLALIERDREERGGRERERGTEEEIDFVIFGKVISVHFKEEVCRFRNTSGTK